MKQVIKCGAALAAMAVALSLGCGTRKSEPIKGPLVLNDHETSGQIVYMRFCHQCHPLGEGGVGPSLNDKPLPGFAVKAQVRGGKGAMPSFDETRISDAGLSDLVDYIRKTRLH